MDLTTKVYKFFADAIGNPGTATHFNTLVLAWQASLGYVSPSITMNWMAIAQDHDLRYLGDIDIQNKFADGTYVIDDGLSFDTGTFRLTGGDLITTKIVTQEIDSGSFQLEGSELTYTSDLRRALHTGYFNFSAPDIHYDPPLIRRFAPGSFRLTGSALDLKLPPAFGTTLLGRARAYVVTKTPLSARLDGRTLRMTGGSLFLNLPVPFGQANLGRTHTYVVRST